MNKPVISFEKYEIININYEKLESDVVEDAEIKTIVSFGISEGLEAGKVEIEVRASDPNNDRIITVKVRGYFLINEELEEDIIKQFLAQNATAILYPYVRSIISMISSLDSEDSILLPTINTSNEKKE